MNRHNIKKHEKSEHNEGNAKEDTSDKIIKIVGIIIVGIIVLVIVIGIIFGVKLFTYLKYQFGFVSCPELNSTMFTEGTSTYAKVYGTDGWNLYLPTGETLTSQRRIDSATLKCHLGNDDGENINYWYCGDKHTTQDITKAPIILKTFIKKDGTIRDNVLFYFYIILDKNGNQIDTVCRKDLFHVVQQGFETIGDAVKVVTTSS